MSGRPSEFITADKDRSLPGAAAQTSQKEGKQMKSILKELVGWIIYILIIVGLAYIIITFVGQRTQVSGRPWKRRSRTEIS